MTDGRVLLAVDGNSLLHRSFHSQAATGFRSADGRPIWAVRGLLSQLVAAVERVRPDCVVVGFDDPASSLRRDTWPEYKANRVDKLETLVEQLQTAVEVLRRLGVAVVVPAGLEADDVLASASRFAAAAGGRSVIVTSDRDAFALIDEHTRVLRIINGGVESSPLLTPERLTMMLGISPAQYRDYAALRGDPSDNLPGVRGIGPKTAAKLLIALDSAHAVFADLDGDGARVVAAVGEACADRLAHPDAYAAWQRNCQVMTMHIDVPLDLDLHGGPGSLPLAAHAVREVFESFKLPWTTSVALAVLAGVDGWTRPAAEAPPVEPSWQPDHHRPSRYSAPRRRLVPAPAKPASEQLSLFDFAPAASR